MSFHSKRLLSCAVEPQSSTPHLLLSLILSLSVFPVSGNRLEFFRLWHASLSIPCLAYYLPACQETDAPDCSICGYRTYDTRIVLSGLHASKSMHIETPKNTYSLPQCEFRSVRIQCHLLLPATPSTGRHREFSLSTRTAQQQFLGSISELRFESTSDNTDVCFSEERETSASSHIDATYASSVGTTQLHPCQHSGRPRSAFFCISSNRSLSSLKFSATSGRSADRSRAYLAPQSAFALRTHPRDQRDSRYPCVAAPQACEGWKFNRFHGHRAYA